jgi:hypothetical protein
MLSQGLLLSPLLTVCHIFCFLQDRKPFRLGSRSDLAFREPSLLFSPANPEKSLGTNLKETRRAVAITTSTRLQDQ